MKDYLVIAFQMNENFVIVVDSFASFVRARGW